MDKLAICNLALQVAGVSDRISSADEDSLERIVCFDWFGFAVDDVMRRYPWRFAMVNVGLIPAKSDHPEYRYQSELPDDCVLVHDVYGENICGKKRIKRWTMRGKNKLYTADKPTCCVYIRAPKPPDDVMNDDWLDDWLSGVPSKVIELIAIRLAACIVPPLLRTGESVATIMQLFNARLSEATQDEVNGLRDTVCFDSVG